MQINKNIKLFINWVLGPVLFVWITWNIARDLRIHTDWVLDPEQWSARMQINPILLLFVLFFLMVAQWSLEAVKWKLLLQTSLPLPFAHAFGAIFRGIAISVVTPNRMGEFIGRVLHLPKSRVVEGVGWTFISNLAQLLVTLLMGTVSLFMLKDELNDLLRRSEWFWINDLGRTISLLVLFIGFFTYLGSPWLLQQVARLNTRLSSRIRILGATPKKILLVVFLISCLRFSVFVFQYWVLFLSMEIPIGYVELALKLSILFLWLAVIPTFTILELGLRWQFALLLFSSFHEHSLSILFIMTLIWCINFMVPALVGAVDFIRYRPFQSKT